MCGITGIFDLRKDRPVHTETLTAMTRKIAHRGPDDEGFFTDRYFGFGFRRLSIIDLHSGNQPLFNEDRTVVMVCNGEIFNYRKLRKELEAKGHRFRTNTDVEVIIHLYEEYGDKLCVRLNGQFAFAIYDYRRESLFMARDHVGIAPLFYTVADDYLIFASEIKAILAHPAVSPSVNLSTLDQIFTFPGPVSPGTMFKGIQSFMPGHSMLINNRELEQKRYWDLDYPLQEAIGAPRAEEYYIEQLDDLLKKSVAYRLQADVPVGFYLSGGLDSSLISTLIREAKPGMAHDSFSICFEDENIDERKYQKLVSDLVNSVHHEIGFDWQQIAARLQKAIYHAECPIKESYDTCSLALSELVGRNNIKVVLSGEGSDELFAGYVGYRFDIERTGQREEPGYAEEMLEQEIRERLWGDAELIYERNLYEFGETKQALYSDTLLESFYDFDITAKPFINTAMLANRHPLHKRSYLDFKLRISDHLLADHGDRVTFANSIEGRYPFLDIDLIEFVKTIPPELMVRDNTEKYILKKYAQRYLPPEITLRQKFAFVAPGSPYLLRQNLEWVNDLLSYETIKRQGYFNPDTIERLKKIYTQPSFAINPTFENDLMMIVLTFQVFLELFEVPIY